MKRRTITLTVELEGPRPDAHALRDHLLGTYVGDQGGRVVDAVIVSDGVGEGPAPTHRGIDAGPSRERP